MDTQLCPKGHTSNEPDYCSECGARITGEVSAPAPMPGGHCPICGAERERADVTFCEICGCNFAAPPPPIELSPPAPDPPPAPRQQVWTCIVSVDPSLQDPGSPAPPTGTGPFTFPLTSSVSLVGRRSEVRAIFPEIPLSYDDAVSHRHALLQLDPAGVLQLRDIGSSNGTRLNGVELTPMVDYTLKDGDQITLGHWTRIAVQGGPA